MSFKLIHISKLPAIFGLMISISTAHAGWFSSEEEDIKSMDCHDAASFIEKHPEKVPRTYEEMLPYGKEAQGVFFDSLSASEKAAIFREHLTRVNEGNRLSLNEKQQEFLDKVRNLLNADFYTKEPDNGLSQTVDDLTKEGLSLFSEEKFATIFSTIGTMTINYRDGTGPNLDLQAKPSCNCSVSSDMCPSDSWEGRGPNQQCFKGKCTSSSWGCGTVWWYACDGTCANIPRHARKDPKRIDPRR